MGRVPLELVYALVLVAAFGHAFWNALVKGSSDHLLMMSAIRLVGLGTGVGLALFVPAPAPASLPWLAGGTLLLFVYYVFMLNAYRVGDLGQVYPVSRGVAPLAVVALTLLAGDEKLGAGTAAGIALICAGILSLSFSGARARASAIAFAVATGLAIAGYTYLNGIGVRLSGSVLGYAAWLEIATAVGLLSYAAARRRGRIGAFARAHWRNGLVAGLFSIAGYVIALWAMTHASIAAVAALRESSVVFAAILGTFLLREPLGARRIASAAAVLAGILLLGFA
jgi:drug/metabolite transporter (DMT)-like permease